VNLPIALDYQADGMAVEIDNEAVDHLLTPKVEPCQSACTEMLPKEKLCWSLLPPQLLLTRAFLGRMDRK
jgi:hypothetical protein